MKLIALFGRGDIGKTHCLGHLINLIHQEWKGCNYLFEGRDARITLEYLGKRITICTWGDNKEEERTNLDKIRQDEPDIAVVATRTKGITVKLVEKFCDKQPDCSLKWVEKYVSNFDDKSGQEYMNHLQAEQILDYINGLIEGQLYYVESLSRIGNEEGQYHVTLMGAEMLSTGIPRTVSLQLATNQLYVEGSEQQIREDDFVFFRSEASDGLFRYGNDSPIAFALRNESMELRNELIGRLISVEDLPVSNYGLPKDVVSYHVNVGHGNCSLILQLFENDNYELWMIDSSTYDYLQHRDYSHDLYHCLSDIAHLVGIDLKDLHISKFMLTHMHFDHYNGLKYLIKHNYVDATTIVYANLYYECSSPEWKKVMGELKNTGCRFVEPRKDYLQQGEVRVCHPEHRLYKNASEVAADSTDRAESHVNDSSVVYGICLFDRTMVFPGDLEQKGFQNMIINQSCSRDLYDSCYYAISHHGSVNGHPTIICSRRGQEVADCIFNNLEVAVLMGRDHAYSGIYDPNVISAFGPKLHRTDVNNSSGQPAKYLKLEWSTNSVTIV